MLNILSDYIHHSLAKAEYLPLEDGTYYGHIPMFKGMLTFGDTLQECKEKLQSTLEGWIYIALQLNLSLPEVHGINLNKRLNYLQSNENKQSKLIKNLRELHFNEPITVSSQQYMTYYGNILSIPPNGEYTVAQFRKVIMEVDKIVSDEEWEY